MSWFSIQRSRSSNRDLEWEDALQRAQDFRRGGDALHAARILSQIADPNNRTEISVHLRERAAAELAVLNGTATGWARVESLGRSFARRAVDPLMIGSFLISGGVANLARGFAQVRLASVGAGGFSAALRAEFAAFALEVPSFVAADRGLRHLSGAEAPRVGWFEQLASTALFLGSVKAVGGLASPVPRVAALANLGGIYLGLRLEESCGLQAPQDEAGRWSEVFDTFFQMRVGGALAAGLLGPTAELGTLRRPQLLDSAELFALPVAAARQQGPHWLTPSGDTEPVGDHWAVAERALGPMGSKRILRFAYRIGRELNDEVGFARLIARTGFDHQATLERAIGRLAHMVAHARWEDGRGNYVNWLVRHAVERMLTANDAGRLDGLLRVLHDGIGIADLEARLAPVLPNAGLPPNSPMAGIRPMRFGAVGQPFLYLLSREARDVVQRFILAARRHSDASLRIDTEDYLEQLGRALQCDGERRSLLERAILAAGTSPTAYLRMLRIYRLMSGQLEVYPKIRELADPALAIQGHAERLLLPTDAGQLRDSQHTGYLADDRMENFLLQFYRRLPGYYRREHLDQARQRRQDILRSIWPEVGAMAPREIAQALSLFADPSSGLLAEKLRQGRLRLLVLDRAEFEAIQRSRIADDHGRFWAGFYLPDLDYQGVTAPTLLIRQLENFSHGPFLDALFSRLATTIHEHEHARHTSPHRARTITEVLRQEMLAYQEEYAWRARHGDASPLIDYDAEGALGWAMYLRDRVEANYFRYKS